MFRKRDTSRRGREYAVLLGVFASILLVVNVAGWRVHASVKRTLDLELGERLVAIASALAASVDAGYVEEIIREPDGLSALIVRTRFERLQSDLALANLVLLDPAGRTVIDLGGTTPPGERHPIHLLHPDAFAATLSGIASSSSLMSSLDANYKNGYAPITGEDGAVAGVVAVEAGVRFFEPLSRIRRTVLAAGLASAVAIGFLGAVLFRLLRTETRLRTAIERTESLSLMGEMAASVAHEIKNPLGIIRASAERIRKRHGTGEEIFDYIPEEVDRLDAILRAYLDFARPTGGGEDTSSSLSEVLESTIRLVRRDLVQSGIELGMSVDPGLRVGIGAGALRQVILNLVLNARQAMAEGGTLTIRCRRHGEHVRMEVADTGEGIAHEDLAKIFEPFHSGRASGSGLGLAIAERAIGDAGGRIEVDSEPGRGTTFAITLRVSHERAEGRGSA